MKKRQSVGVRNEHIMDHALKGLYEHGPISRISSKLLQVQQHRHGDHRLSFSSGWDFFKRLINPPVNLLVRHSGSGVGYVCV
ncbi:Uncharacterized protein APZ42_024757 [Daphnia magna]|uniref:Uncharacterized protein n=1 Tax=Daphnia magna TaxID=35525 RepID=A0A164TTE0_9CRUS|nr:Uncharacterized protein APZ42_024757 [Daphnia magna]